MVEIIVIAALAKNDVIGRDNDIPWRIMEDFKHFKELTMGFPCIMGDKTYESLPSKARPLPGRENIVCTFNKEFKQEGTTVFFDFNEAIEYVKGLDVDKAFVIGGATIYKLGLEVADTLELTRIDKDIEGDTLFPTIDFSEWDLVNEDKGEGKNIITGEVLSFSFLTYHRRK